MSSWNADLSVEANSRLDMTDERINDLEGWLMEIIHSVTESKKEIGNTDMNVKWRQLSLNLIREEIEKWG